jgi:hypothetical protein
VFNYPGMGLLTVTAADNDDIPTVLGTTLVITIFTVAGSLLADILYAMADPRIRLGSANDVTTHDETIASPTRPVVRDLPGRPGRRAILKRSRR